VSNDEKRAAKIIEAANAAISKMTDPEKRTVAKNKLTLIKGKIVEANRQPKTAATRTQPLPGRELDFDR